MLAKESMLIDETYNLADHFVAVLSALSDTLGAAVGELDATLVDTIARSPYDEDLAHQVAKRAEGIWVPLEGGDETRGEFGWVDDGT